MDSSMFSEFQRSNSNSFASTTIKDFSPIRRENLFFADDTVSSTPDTHSRRSSTPNHSVHAAVNGRPTCTLGEEQGGKQETSVNNISLYALDTPTQNQVERIRSLLESTKHLLPGVSGDSPVNAV